MHSLIRMWIANGCSHDMVRHQVLTRSALNANKIGPAATRYITQIILQSIRSELHEYEDRSVAKLLLQSCPTKWGKSGSFSTRLRDLEKYQRRRFPKSLFLRMGTLVEGLSSEFLPAIGGAGFSVH